MVLFFWNLSFLHAVFSVLDSHGYMIIQRKANTFFRYLDDVGLLMQRAALKVLIIFTVKFTFFEKHNGNLHLTRSSSFIKFLSLWRVHSLTCYFYIDQLNSTTKWYCTWSWYTAGVEGQSRQVEPEIGVCASQMNLYVLLPATRIVLVDGCENKTNFPHADMYDGS